MRLFKILAVNLLFALISFSSFGQGTFYLPDGYQTYKDDNENEIISPIDKQMSLREIYKMPKASIKNEIKKEILKIKNNKALTPRGRMSIIVKLAIILTGLGLVLLIVSFWLWIFNVGSNIYDPYTGTYESSSYSKLPLVIGLVTLAAGLFLFILSFLAN